MTGLRASKTAKWSVVAFVVTMLFLGFDANPTVPAVPVAVPAAPDLDQIARLEEVADWLVGRAAGGHRLNGMVRKDLTDVIKESPASFELFRAHLDEGVQQEFLHGLPYGDEIERVAVENRVDALLLAALVEAESSFLPNAVSSVGAVGLTQVMPSTARWLGQQGDLNALTDPSQNLEVGAAYLARLLTRFDGDITMALAAYNAGPGAVARYGGVPPYRETRAYVTKVLRIYARHNRAVWRTSNESRLFTFDS